MNEKKVLNMSKPMVVVSGLTRKIPVTYLGQINTGTFRQYQDDYVYLIQLGQDAAIYPMNRFGQIGGSSVRIENAVIRETTHTFRNVYPNGSFGDSKHPSLYQCYHARRKHGEPRVGIVKETRVFEDDKLVDIVSTLVWREGSTPPALDVAKQAPEF